MSILITLLFSSPVFAIGPAYSQGCAFNIAHPAAYVERTFSDFVTLPNGHELFVRIEKQRGSPPKKWFLLVHGLLETHRSWDDVSDRLVSRGYGVVRLDLRGFGRSLLRELQAFETKSRVFYPESLIPYGDQVEDILQLLGYLAQHEGIERPDLVGHSMGGALVLATAADPRAADLIGERVTGIAPYIYRVDFDMLEYMMYQGFNPLVRISTMTQFIPRSLKMGSAFWTDSLSEHALRHGLNQYFDEKILSRELRLDPEHLPEVRRLFVTSAIAAKRGLDQFNAYSVLDDVPAKVRYDLIYGERDPLIRKGAAVQFGAEVERRGGQVLGLDTEHDVQEKEAVSVVERLVTP